MATSLCLTPMRSKTFCVFVHRRRYYNKFDQRAIRLSIPNNMFSSCTSGSSMGAVCMNSNVPRFLTVARSFSCVNERIMDNEHELLHSLQSNVLLSHNYSTDNSKGPHNRMQLNSEGPRQLPRLMKFPEIVWPNLIKMIRNWFFANLVVVPYLDHQFRVATFEYGSRQAVEMISECLSKGDCEGLKEFVTKEAISEIEKNLDTFTLEQKQDLKVIKEDIFYCFPYEIGIMFEGEGQNQRRFVEITMVYHILKGLKEMKDEGKQPPLNLGFLPEYQDKLQLCNYRFIREYTKGFDSDWYVNIVNHYKQTDLLKG